MSEMNDTVRNAVKEEMKKLEASEQLGQIEEQLELAQTSITELTEVLTNKDTELATLTEEKENLLKQLADLDAKVKELEVQISETLKIGQDNEQRAVAAEDQLANISKDRALEVRMRELEAANVIKKGEKLEAQKVRVREMSTEEFNAYRDELIEIRAEVAESFKIAAAEKEIVVETVVNTPPADISAAGKEAASLNLNVEGEPVVSLKEKYQSMGRAMAEKVKKEIKKEQGS